MVEEDIRPVLTNIKINTWRLSPLLWFLPLGLILGIGMTRIKLPSRKKRLQFPSQLPSEKSTRLHILHTFFLSVVAQRCKKQVSQLTPEDFLSLGDEAQAIQKLFHHR